MSEKIWYEDVVRFLSPPQLFHILPLQTMTLEEKLNAITRFCLYLGVILSLVNLNAKFLFIGILAGLVSFVIYEFEKKERKTAETFLRNNDIDIVHNRLCSRSTVENPFMNPTIVDIQDRPDRPEACSVSSCVVQEAIDKNYEKRVFRDVNDIFGRDISAREFYTVPSTTIPNKQDVFAEWLYGTGATCKEGNGLECDYKGYRYILR